MTRRVRECAACGARISAQLPARFVKDGLDVIRCPECGLLFRRTLPSRSELDIIYGDSAFTNTGDLGPGGYDDYRADAVLHRRNARRRLERIQLLGPPPGALLDVGCAAGFFVAEAAREGWSASGVDISREMTRYASTEVGASVLTGTLDDVRLPPASLGVVTMWDYIEHSTDPRHDLTRAAELLVPGGLCVLTTGDAASFVARVTGRRWHLLNPTYHNFYFTARTLERILSRAGLALVSVEHPSAHYDVRYLAYKARTISPENRLLRAAADLIGKGALGRRSLRVNLFDIMEVVARRPIAD